MAACNSSESHRISYKIIQYFETRLGCIALVMQPKRVWIACKQQRMLYPGRNVHDKRYPTLKHSWSNHRILEQVHSYGYISHGIRLIVVLIPPTVTRIAILGYSGSGKSTAARSISMQCNFPVLHLDTVHWLPSWHERDDNEAAAMIDAFLDSHDSWIIEGNYHKLAFARRMQEADCIIILNVNRYTCLCRAMRRWFTYRHSTRPDLTQGCNEKMDLEFLQWLLWKGRSRERGRAYHAIAQQYPQKCHVITQLSPQLRTHL